MMSHFRLGIVTVTRYDVKTIKYLFTILSAYDTFIILKQYQSKAV